MRFESLGQIMVRKDRETGRRKASEVSHKAMKLEIQKKFLEMTEVGDRSSSSCL